jgi:hypothetical protein
MIHRQPLVRGNLNHVDPQPKTQWITVTAALSAEAGR